MTTALTDTGSALLAGVLADPHADAPRLVYADWLEEGGQSARAEFIRLSVEAARVRCEYSRIDRCIDRRRGWRDVARTGCPACKGAAAMVGRADRLLTDDRRNTWFSLPAAGEHVGFAEDLPLRWWPAGDSRGLPRLADGDLDRGFVGTLVIDTGPFLALAGPVFERHPILRVRPADLEPARDRHAPGRPPVFRWFFRPDRWDGGTAEARAAWDVPPHLWPYMRTGPAASADYPRYRDAVRAVSAACVAYGRKVAGLPPLVAAR